MTLTGGLISPQPPLPPTYTHVLWGPKRTEKPVHLGPDRQQPRLPHCAVRAGLSNSRLPHLRLAASLGWACVGELVGQTAEAPTPGRGCMGAQKRP